MRRDARAGHPGAVRDDRDRDGRQRDHGPAPIRGGSVKYPNTIPRVSSEISERMPLQASATSSVVFARTSTLPSLSTGISAALIANSPARDARQLKGEGDLVEDDRRDRDHQQQEREREDQRAQVRPAEEEQNPARQHAER